MMEVQQQHQEQPGSRSQEEEEMEVSLNFSSTEFVFLVFLLLHGCRRHIMAKATFELEKRYYLCNSLHDKSFATFSIAFLNQM